MLQIIIMNFATTKARILEMCESLFFFHIFVRFPFLKETWEGVPFYSKLLYIEISLNRKCESRWQKELMSAFTRLRK